MQVPKDHTRQSILIAAEDIFLERGFAKANMRDIAKLAQVGLSNIYNYYDGKDKIFCAIVQPVVDVFQSVLLPENDDRNIKVMSDFVNDMSNKMFAYQVDFFLGLMRNNKRQLTLLLTKSQGSSFENFVEDFTDTCSERLARYMKKAEILHPELAGSYHPFMFRMQVIWTFQFFREIICADMMSKDMYDVVSEFVRYSTFAWRNNIKK